MFLKVEVNMSNNSGAIIEKKTACNIFPIFLLGPIGYRYL